MSEVIFPKFSLLYPCPYKMYSNSFCFGFFSVVWVVFVASSAVYRPLLETSQSSPPPVLHCALVVTSAGPWNLSSSSFCSDRMGTRCNLRSSRVQRQGLHNFGVLLRAFLELVQCQLVIVVLRKKNATRKSKKGRKKNVSSRFGRKHRYRRCQLDDVTTTSPTSPCKQLPEAPIFF